MTPIDFVHGLRWDDLPPPVQHQTRRCLKDLLAVAAAGLRTSLSGIIRDYAAEDMPGPTRILFDDRTASGPAAALAMGMSLDSLDGHDGYNPAKGHIGCPLLPALLVFADTSAKNGQSLSGEAFLTALAMGYEIGARASEAQHATCPDYQTSGSWGAVVAAAAGARLLGLDQAQTQHALGIAEYHGPRSQMMRCIDYPTMLKDGSGWGAMAGVSAVGLARRGFTGAPALIMEHPEDVWGDLGTDWRILRQYFKPYPVCRWAQAPIEAILDLRRRHAVTHEAVAQITVESFHESVRLATAAPATTEEAQYSTSFPCAVALVHGDVQAEHLTGAALKDPAVLRLSRGLVMDEAPHANAAFPTKRFARVTLDLREGASLTSDWFEPRWDFDAPPTDTELDAKYTALAAPVLGPTRSAAIARAVADLDTLPLTALTDLLFHAPEANAGHSPALRA